MRVWNRLALGVFALMAMPALAFGQQQQGSWGIDVNLGMQGYDDASALNSGGFLGSSAMYQAATRFAVGPSLQFTRTSTDEVFFTGVLDFGADSARVFQVGQSVSSLHYTLDARFDIMPGNDVNPYVMGGVGGYTLYLETQANEGPKRLSDLMFQAGGGIRWSLSDGAGISLDLRDIVYTNYDRDGLNPIRDIHRNCSEPGNPSSMCRYPDAETAAPEKKDSLHNIRFAIGLTFIPGVN